jgi:hypothetical protein
VQQQVGPAPQAVKFVEAGGLSMREAAWRLSMPAGKVNMDAAW